MTPDNKIDKFKGKQKKFSKDYQPKNNGRPRNVFKQYHNLYECSYKDIEAVFVELISKSVDELSEIKNDKNTVALRACIAAAIIEDKKHGALSGVSFLADRLFGKAIQKVESTISINQDDEKVAEVLKEFGVSKS